MKKRKKTRTPERVPRRCVTCCRYFRTILQTSSTKPRVGWLRPPNFMASWALSAMYSMPVHALLPLTEVPLLFHLPSISCWETTTGITNPTPTFVRTPYIASLEERLRKWFLDIPRIFGKSCSEVIGDGYDMMFVHFQYGKDRISRSSSSDKSPCSAIQNLRCNSFLREGLRSPNTSYAVSAYRVWNMGRGRTSRHPCTLLT